MQRKPFCGSAEHVVSRRGFLKTVGAAAGAAAFADLTGIQALGSPQVAEELRQSGKRCILLWLAGGASQMETWDPKPGAVTGGPFQSIQTTVPGVRICELMPRMANRLKDTCIIRSLNTRNGDHGGASRLMMRGRPGEAGLDYPDLGAVLARELGEDGPVPDYVSFYFATEGRNMAPGHPGFLGARYGSMDLYTSMIPENIRLAGISAQEHQQRAQLRDLISGPFEANRAGNGIDSHRQAYDRVGGIMSCERLFDIGREPQPIRDRYGPTLFGQQALAARRLVEAGVPFVRVGRAWWDSHGQNFETHQEMVPELDHVMSTLLDDLEQRGLLENTLVVTLAEFGRTPAINSQLGRDHFASAWSCSLSGCGVHGGSVYGRTDPTGNTVADGEIGAARLFATIYQALGINHRKNYYVGARPVPLTDPGTEPIREVLA
jgi:hypothetical protein